MHTLHFSLRTLIKPFSDQPNSLPCSSSSPILSLQLGFTTRRRRKPHITINSILISCKSSCSNGNLGRRSNNGDDHDDFDDDRYIEAVLLVSETLRHYHLRKQGFLRETKWTSHLYPFSIQTKESATDFRSIGHEFLRRFQSPTVFLKIACDGDLLLPITVGEFAMEKLVDSFRNDKNVVLPNQFQFVKNLVEKLGYEVKMVRITERVVNTYYARIYFAKVPGEKAILSVEARPSDAVNVARRCKVAIFVNKQIILTDAIKIHYGARRGHDAKSVYDVYLDRY